jgi:putative transposase
MAFMPRGNRYIVPGYVYHLTHRCHDRKFLLKFACDRNRYRQRLREAVLELQVSLLSYNVTSNHVHLVAYSDDEEQISLLMQQAAGEFARDYNRRKGRSGAVWNGRYHATMVDSGEYLWECLLYVELNMVRCGAVAHPSQWQWSGYSELMGLKRRNRLLDIERLLELLRNVSLHDFRNNFEHGLRKRIAEDKCRRDPKWTESVGVGSLDFIDALRTRVPLGRTLERRQESGGWTLREAYGSLFAAENEPITSK